MLSVSGQLYHFQYLIMWVWINQMSYRASGNLTPTVKAFEVEEAGCRPWVAVGRRPFSPQQTRTGEFLLRRPPLMSLDTWLQLKGSLFSFLSYEGDFWTRQEALGQVKPSGDSEKPGLPGGGAARAYRCWWWPWRPDWRGAPEGRGTHHLRTNNPHGPHSAALHHLLLDCFDFSGKIECRAR